MASQIDALNQTMIENLSHNSMAKDRFAKTSQQYLTYLAQQLELREFEISFNPGGVAVSGDAMLMGMWSDDNGIYVKISQSMGRPIFMYRSIRHMRDYAGGTNRYIWGYTDLGSFSKTVSDDTVIKELLKLRI